MSCSWWTVQHYTQTPEADAVASSDAAGVLMVAAAANEAADVDGLSMEVWLCCAVAAEAPNGLDLN